MKILIYAFLLTISSNICSEIPFKGEYADNVFLEPPLPILPINLEIHVSLTPFFDWKTVGGPDTQYELQVTLLTDVFFQFPLIDIDGISNSSYQITMKNVLNSFTSYKWRVRAKGGHESSTFSPVFIFITFK